MFYTCISKDKDNGKFWCATTEDYDRDEMWSYCADTSKILGTTTQSVLICQMGQGQLGWILEKSEPEAASSVDFSEYKQKLERKFMYSRKEVCHKIKPVVGARHQVDCFGDSGQA